MKYTYAVVKADDHGKDRLLAFYKANPDSNIRPRPEPIIRSAIDDASFCALEEDEGEIQGATGYFSYLDYSYFELGASINLVNGYGLHHLFLSSRLLSLVLTSAAEDQIIFTGVKENNEPSIHSIEKAGFTRWEPPQDLIDARATALQITPSTEGMLFYQFEKSPENLAVISERYLEFKEQGNLIHKDQHMTMGLTVNHALLDSPFVMQQLEEWKSKN